MVVITHDEGGRSQDVNVDIWGPTEGDKVSGSTGKDGGSMELTIITGSGNLSAATAVSVGGRARVLEDWGDAGVTADGGETEGREEPAATEVVEGRSAAVDP